MSVAAVVADVIAGALIGVMGGLFGVGGGIIAIPLLVLVFGLQQQTAEGTALVTIVPNVVIGLWAYSRRDRLDGRIALTLAAAGTVLSAVFAALALGWDEHALGRAFAIFLLATAGWMVWSLFGKVPKRAQPLQWGWTAVLGAFGGALSGIFGIGGATITPPIMTALFGVPQTAAQGYALALVAPGSIAALATFARAGHVDWIAGVPLAVGGAVAVPAGVALAHRLPQRTLKLLFAAMVVATSAILIVRYA